MKTIRSLVAALSMTLATTFFLAGCATTASVENSPSNKAGSSYVQNTSGQAPGSGEKFLGVVTLPKSFSELASNGYPVGMTWAIQNQLSSHSGYDLTPILGQTVRVYSKAPLIQLRDDSGNVVGEWDSTDTTAQGKTFKQVTGMSLDAWIEAQHGDVSSQRLEMSPQDTIRAFYGALNDHDQVLAMSFVDPLLRFNWATNGVNEYGLYHSAPFDYYDLASHYESIQVLSMKEVSSVNPTMHYDVPTKFFAVQTEGQYSGFVYKNGINTWVVQMDKATPDSPWTFDGTPTGGY